MMMNKWIVQSRIVEEKKESGVKKGSQEGGENEGKKNQKGRECLNLVRKEEEG